MISPSYFELGLNDQARRVEEWELDAHRLVVDLEKHGSIGREVAQKIRTDRGLMSALLCAFNAGYGAASNDALASLDAISMSKAQPVDRFASLDLS